MHIAFSLEQLALLPDSDQPSIVTIGNFDGVHVGHQSVIAAVRARAQATGARSVVVTFDPHPGQFLNSGLRTPLITPLPYKLELLAQTGVDLVLVMPFNETLRTLPAADFAEGVLHHALHTTEIHEGENFRFGYQAEADIASLHTLGEELGFGVQAYQPIVRRGAPVSSSRIRELVAQGSVEVARALLTRCFALESTPARGRGYGTKYAVPTINLTTPEALLPQHGVYVTVLQVGRGTDSQTFQGVTNAGNRPTFGADSYAIETHLFDFKPLDLNETTPLRLHFLHRLRGERRFASAEELKSQIQTDVAEAQRFFSLCRKSFLTSFVRK